MVPDSISEEIEWQEYVNNKIGNIVMDIVCRANKRYRYPSFTLFASPMKFIPTKVARMQMPMIAKYI